MPGARPHRLPLAVPHGHARHGHPQPHLQELRSVRGLVQGALRIWRARSRQDQGETNAYGLFYLQERGSLFLGPQVKVYGGQIIGLHSRDNDLVVNPSKAKKLTNIRTTAADEKLTLTPPREFTLESALEFINDDELVEVTPKAIRLRKRYLDENERKRLDKANRVD